MVGERPPLRVAVIGQGFMGRAHAFGWSRAAQLDMSAMRPELVLLCGRDAVRLEQNAPMLGFRSWSASWQDVVRSADVDLIDICTPGSSHAEIALAALAAGKHVLCEKPLANSVEEATQLAASARRAGRDGHVTMVGFNYRRVPAVAYAKDVIAEGRIGEVRHVRAAYLQDWLVDPEFPLTWRLDSAQSGSGALGDLGAHVIDLVQFMTGEQISDVLGVLTTFVSKRPVARGESVLTGATEHGARLGTVTVDDACVALARLAGGAIASIEATRVAPGRKNSLSIEVNGSGGSLRFDLERLNELELYEVARGSEGFQRVLATEPWHPYIGQWWPPGHVIGWDATFVHEMQDLMAALAENRQPSPSFLDGLQVQLVLDALSRSAQTGRWVEIGRLPGPGADPVRPETGGGT